MIEQPIPLGHGSLREADDEGVERRVTVRRAMAFHVCAPLRVTSVVLGASAEALANIGAGAVVQAV
jgi:hypothetical protein